MRGHTHATRATTHSKSRSGPATAPRDWEPAAAAPELAGGGHDLARISVFAPAAGAPIQRMKTLFGDSDSDEENDLFRSPLLREGSPRQSYGSSSRAAPLLPPPSSSVNALQSESVPLGSDPLSQFAADYHPPPPPRVRTRPPAPPRRQPVTGQNVVDFATANTPGPITGVSGAAEALTSLVNPPTSNVPSGFANSGYANRLAPASRALSGVSAGTNVLSGGADLLAIGADLRAMHRKGGAEGGWKRFWSGLKANFRNPFARSRDRSAEDAEKRSEAKRLVVNTATNAADLGANQVPSAISSIASATGHAAPAVLGTVASGASMGINAVVAGRSLWRGGRAWKHESNVNEMLRNDRQLDEDDPQKLSGAMRAAAEHQAAQMNKRKKRSLIGAAGATLGAVGGGLLLGGLLGASMLTPIGWGLAAAGGLVAAGLGAHKLYRWHQKRKAGQLGVERERHAQTLHKAINNPDTAEEHEQGKKLLAARGITPEQATGPEGIDFLKRKAEAW